MKVSYVVRMESATLGTEEYRYDSLKEALKALEGLIKMALDYQAQDGIPRSFCVVEEENE